MWKGFSALTVWQFGGLCGKMYLPLDTAYVLRLPSWLDWGFMNVTWLTKVCVCMVLKSFYGLCSEVICGMWSWKMGQSSGFGLTAFLCSCWAARTTCACNCWIFLDWGLAISVPGNPGASGASYTGWWGALYHSSCSIPCHEAGQLAQGVSIVTSKALCVGVCGNVSWCTDEAVDGLLSSMDGAVCAQAGYCAGTTRASCCRRVLLPGKSASRREAGAVIGLLPGTQQMLPGVLLQVLLG